MADKTIIELCAESDIHKPKECSACESRDVEYLGLGQYRCKECLTVMYDDYGKVRQYLEKHPGSTEIEVHEETGVTREVIRMFVHQERISVVNGRNNNNVRK